MAGLDDLSKLVALKQAKTQTSLMESKLVLQKDVQESAKEATGADGAFSQEKFLSNLQGRGRALEAQKFESEFLKQDVIKLETEAAQSFAYIDTLRQSSQLFLAGDEPGALAILNKGKPPEQQATDFEKVKGSPDDVILTMGGQKKQINLPKMMESLSRGETQYIQNMTAMRERQNKAGKISENALKGQLIAQVFFNEKMGRGPYEGLTPKQRQLVEPVFDQFKIADMMKIEGFEKVLKSMMLDPNQSQALVQFMDMIQKARGLSERQAKGEGLTRTSRMRDPKTGKTGTLTETWNPKTNKYEQTGWKVDKK